MSTGRFRRDCNQLRDPFLTFHETLRAPAGLMVPWNRCTQLGSLGGSFTSPNRTASAASTWRNDPRDEGRARKPRSCTPPASAHRRGEKNVQDFRKKKKWLSSSHNEARCPSGVVVVVVVVFFRQKTDRLLFIRHHRDARRMRYDCCALPTAHARARVRRSVAVGVNRNEK